MFCTSVNSRTCQRFLDSPCRLFSGALGRSDFSQRSTRICLLGRHNKSLVELVMRRHAVIFAVATAWLIGTGRAEAKLDILVDKATQRMMVMQDGYMRYLWPVSTGRDEL